MDERRTALVIGATGGIGGAVARALLARGWRVRALNRAPDAARASDPRLEWVRSDAMDAASVVAAAKGVQVIVHGANPPGYRNWAGLALPMLESTIAAARASGARIVFPGTVYNFGPDAGEAVDETSPQNPLTRKGKIRVAMERRLAEAAAEGVRTLVVRAGDYFGPKTQNNWFSQGMLLGARGRVRRVFDPAVRGVGHAWAYVPDVAETMARLLEREGELAPFDVFHFAGTWAEGGSLAKAVRRASGDETLPIHAFPWWLVTLGAPFNETFREMREMTYLWRSPLRLLDGKLRATLGDPPATPVDQAVAAALAGLGLSPAPAPRAAGALLAV